MQFDKVGQFCGQKARMGNVMSLNNSSVNSPPERDVTYFNRTLVIILHLICLLTKLLPHLSKEETHQVKKAVFKFIKVDARGRGGQTPLHLACSRESSAVGRYPICQFPSAEVVSLLLECGADIEAQDNEENFPLHTAAINKPPAKPNVIMTLLENGAHLDAVNADERTFADLVKPRQPVHEVVNVLKFTNLQCLAARVIQRHNIPHAGLLPTKLSDFVELH
jgi:hypothetical protein